MNVPRTCRVSCTLASLLALAAPSLAAPPGPPQQAQPVSTKLIFQDKVNSVETKLADLLQRRGEPSDLRGPLLELSIDLHVLARWSFAHAAEAQPDGDLQIALLLRGVSFLTAADQLVGKLQQSTTPLNGAELEQLKQFHDMTYSLPKGASVGEVDQLCRAAGTLLVGVAAPVSAGVKSVPLMRPKPIATASAPIEERPGLVELATRAQQAKVGPALHRELIALAASTADPQPKEAAPELMDTLFRSVQLAESLSTNVAVDAAARAKLEGEMSAGLALYTDARTRDAAHARLENIARYGNVVARINRMKIATSVKEALAPVFTWARLNPEKGPRLFDAIETYVQLCDHFDARKGASVTLAPAAKRIVDGLTKEFSADRSGLLDDAGSFAHPDNISGAPEQFVQRVDRMKRTLASIDANERLPRAITVLNKFRPRPGGGLEKRAAVESSNSASPLSTVLRDEGNDFLETVEALAVQAGSITGEAPALPPEVIKDYTGGKLAAFESRRSEMVTELASQLAAGKDFDRGRLALLQTTGALEHALSAAAVVEDVIARGDVLNRWVDWSINGDQLKSLLSAYRADTLAAVAGVAQGDDSSMQAWAAAQHRFAPLLALLVRDGEYLEACSAFPASPMTEPARLTTPLDGQPFVTERRASLLLWLNARCAQLGDQHAADQVFDALSERLRAELHVTE